jgi:16S rRNA processing protein RimM
MRLWALAGDGSRRELEVEEFWPHKTYLVLKFAGIDSISDAETLSGCELQVPAEQRAKLESGWAYVSDLVGCVVLDGDREIGQVQDVQFGAGEAPLLIIQSGSKVYEVPYAEAYLVSTDLAQKKICMKLPEGLLEVNAPLTAEEKEEQRNSSNKKMSS